MTMLTAKEVAARVGVTVRTVRRWHARGLKVRKLGHRITRYHVDDVDAFLRANSTTLTSEGTPPSGGSPSATP